MLATADVNGQLQAVNLDTGEIAFSTRIPNHQFWFLSFTADSNRLVTVGNEADRQSIRIWSAHSGIQLQSLLGGSGRPEAMVVHPLSADVLVTGPLTRTWNIHSPPPRASLFPYRSASFLGSDELCLCGGFKPSAALMNLAGTSPRMQWQHQEPNFGMVQASPDGRTVAIAQSEDGGSFIDLHIHDGQALKRTHRLTTEESISFMRLTADGSRLMSFVPLGRTSRLFDTASGSIQMSLEHGEIVSINDAAWIGNQRVVGVATMRGPRGTSRSEEHVLLWDAVSGDMLQSRRHTAVLNCLAAAPDGRTIAEAGVDRMIRIRDSSTLAVRQEFRAHDDSILVLAFHPHRPLLASASADLTIKIWDMETSQCIEVIRGVVLPPSELQFSPSGARLLSVSASTVHVWSPSTLQTEKK